MISLRSQPREYGDRDLPALIHRSEEPVIVESYFAGWDEPWRSLSDGAWKAIGSELGERVRCARVETGCNREMALRFGVEIIPAVLVFLGGEVVARFSGAVEVEKVVAAVRGALRDARALQSSLQELQTTGARAGSILRRRTAELPQRSLAAAG